jgi:hypothetical protein
MPIATGSSGGSYFYPVAQKPNSSYPTTDLRGLGSHPATATGIGRLYVLSSSNDLYYKDADGNEVILGSAGGSGENVFDNVYVSSSLLVKGDTVLSGNVVVGGQIYDLNSNLILSSAVGSVIAASGSIDFTNTDKAYHLRAVNSNLILSSSAGSVIALSGVLDFQNTENKNYTIVNRSGFLILSSSAGSLISISGNLTSFSASIGLTSSLARLHVFSNSPSDAPTVFSGDHLVVGRSDTTGVNSGGVFMQYNASTNTGLLGSLSPGTAWRKLFIKLNELVVNNPAGSTLNLLVAISTSLGADIHTTGSFSCAADSAFHIRAIKSPLILTSSISSVVALSASQDFVNADKAYHVRAVNSDLVLSSSATSVVALSSALDFQNIGNKGYTIANRSGHLILSSSVGSVVALSSNLYFPVDAVANAGHIVAVNSHLILSSSVGSTIAMSGALQLQNTTTGSIVSPTVGSFVWDTVTNQAMLYNGTVWIALASGSNP